MDTREYLSSASNTTPLEHGADIALHAGSLPANHLEVLMNAAANAAVPSHETSPSASIERKVLTPVYRMLLLSQIITELRKAEGSDNPVTQIGNAALQSITTMAQHAAVAQPGGQPHERI